MLIDSHCHIHDTEYNFDIESIIQNAKNNDVQKIICIGTNQADSINVTEFVNKYENIYASVGVHPHEVKNGWMDIEKLLELNDSKIVAVGEIGLDYHYDHSPRDIQKKALKDQIELALKFNLPIIFHVREAFDDFWPIIDEYLSAGQQIRGVLHSFTDSPENAEKAIERGLFIGINGYSTFAKDPGQKSVYKSYSIDKIILETDAPYLTPVPFRGKVNEPAFVKNIAEYLCEVRNISFNEIATITTQNAEKLFNI